MGQPRYKKAPLSRGRLVEGLALVVNDNRRHHTLNRTATRVWIMAQSGVSEDEAIDDVTSKFAVDRETARAEVAACLDELVSRHILVAEPG
jgi:hypothetical protein